jgi:hypothetical protein
VVLDAPPGWIAHWQMHRLKADGGRCRAALAASSRLRVVPVLDRHLDGDCGYFDAVRLERSAVPFDSPVTSACALAAAFAWYQGALQQTAARQMHSRLVRMDHAGVFACRNVNHQAEGSRSEHATANAIDITAFHFADGRTASVLRDYGKPTPQGRFLEQARQAACQVFNGVLGPRYNRLHASHFHLDMGPYLICR